MCIIITISDPNDALDSVTKPEAVILSCMVVLICMI
jgi:hypothetical protein